MGRTVRHRSETDLEFIIDSTRCGTCEKDGVGIWLITLYFSIKNRTSTKIRITNLNGKVDRDTRDLHPALTLGAREVVDLRIKDSLLREGRYCDLAPNEEQPITGLLEVVNWFRDPSNRVDDQYTLLFSLSADYRVIDIDKTLSVTIPAFYCFQSIEPDAPSGCSSARLVCITEHNVEELIEQNEGNDRVICMLREARKELPARTARAELIWAGQGRTLWKRFVSRPLVQQIVGTLVVLVITAVAGYLIHLALSHIRW
jgi:hypothetical protein